MSDIVRDRPRIPSNYGVSTESDGLLAWERVATAIADAEIYWVSTTDGANPHLIPIHAVSLDGTIYLGGDPATKWARNLTSNPAVDIGVQHDGLQVMVRGTAAWETPTAELHHVMREATDAKYGWSHGDDPVPLWVIRPSKVIAFDPAEFATSPTRFTFEEAS